jgi:hypothetical protein
VPEVYPQGYRFSFAEGRGPDALLAAFGVDPADAEPLTREATAEEFGVDPGTYRVGESGGWGFLVEEVGGSHTDQLRELSTGGRAVSVCRVGSGTSLFEYYEDGERTLWFEPLFPDRRRGRDADRFLDAMGRVGLDPGGRLNLALVAPAVAALDLATDVSGVRLTREAAEGVLLTGAAAPDLAWSEG